MRAAFAKIDHDFMSGVQGDSVLMQAGTTVIMALFMGGTLHVANLGDSRCVMGKTDGSHLPLSVDHKPSHPKVYPLRVGPLPSLFQEKERLEKHGFQVINDRINGNLAVSRAIGDLPYKNVETLASSGASSKPTIKVRLESSPAFPSFPRPCPSPTTCTSSSSPLTGSGASSLTSRPCASSLDAFVRAKRCAL